MTAQFVAIILCSSRCAGFRSFSPSRLDGRAIGTVLCPTMSTGELKASRCSPLANVLSQRAEMEDFGSSGDRKSVV